jgi:hypothetical protein
MTSGTVETTTTQLAGLQAEQWDDLHFRHYFGDTGKYPTSGVLSSSPDIVPLGREPVADPQYLIDGANWGADYGGATYASEPNYIYLRGENLASAAASGKLYLYYSPASLLLWPIDPLNPNDGWSKHPLTTDRGAQWVDVSADAGQRFCTVEPFRWVPKPIANDHYCMIARIVTERHPNDIPAPGTLTDFAAYISQHPNLAWRNVTTINPAKPVSTTTVDYSQGSKGGEVYINLNCTYVPDGSAIAFTCGTPGPRPLINKSKTTVRNEVDPDEGIPRFTATIRTVIPANWSSNISYTWYSEGKVPLGGMEVQLDAVMPTTQDHPLLGAVARPLAELGVAEEMIPAAGPRYGVRLGSDAMVTQRSAVTGYGRNGHDAEPASSSVLFSGVSWAEKHSSIFGSWTDTHDVTVQHEDSTDVVTFTDTTSGEAGDAGEAGGQEAADATFDARLSTGPYTGPGFAVLTTENVPVGCNVWFRNVDGTVRIAVQPARVDNAREFTVTAKVANLPEDYSAKVRAYLQLEGHELPPNAKLTFSIFELVTTGERGPVPGKLLGAVALKP